MRFLRRSESHLETTIEAERRELNSTARRLLGRSGGFVISSLVIQMLLDDPALDMAGADAVERVSSRNLPRAKSENLIQGFIDLIEDVAARESAGA
jgi:hypothetical protein